MDDIEWRYRVVDRAGAVRFGPHPSYKDVRNWAMRCVLNTDKPVDVQISPDGEQWQRAAAVRPGPIGGPVNVTGFVTDFPSEVRK